MRPGSLIIRALHHRWVAVFAIAAIFPIAAHASDFSFLMYLIIAGAVIVMAPLWLIAYLVTRDLNSIVVRSLIWGSLIAVSFTPLNTPGGNGRSSGPPILDFLVSLFGGDPVYATAAARALLISVPVCSAAVALFLWMKSRQSDSTAQSDAD